MSQKFYGSICITDVIAALKAKHSAFSRSDKNGKIYCNIDAWLNDQPDKFGHIISMRLVPGKGHAGEDPRTYIANLKLSEKKETEITDNDIADINLKDTFIDTGDNSDLPF
jgi:hypothetical protein